MLEMDCGSEENPKFGEKVDKYRRYMAQSTWQQALGCGEVLPILTVTTGGETRLANMRAAVRGWLEYTGAADQLWWFTNTSRLAAHQSATGISNPLAALVWDQADGHILCQPVLPDQAMLALALDAAQQAIHDYDRASGAEQQAMLAKMERLQRTIATPATFNQFLADHNSLQQLNLLVIDQFEETFTQAQPSQRDTFLAILENLAPFATLRTHLIATMRIDYLPTLFINKPLYDIAKQGIDLRAMTTGELKAAIERPVQQLYPSKRFEPALVERLNQDAAADATYLPLLQVTLEQLWKDGSLKLAAYRDLTSSLREQVEDVYNYEDYSTTRCQPRSEADKATIMQIILDLAQVSPDRSFADVRRPRERRELAKDSADRQQLIDDLLTARLLSVGAGASSGDVVIDIIHESLIRNWERLQEAIKAQRQQLEQRERFERALADWLENNRSDDYLLSGIRLAEANALAAARDVSMQSAPASELLGRSIANQEATQQRQLRRTRFVVFILAILLLLSSGGVVLSFFLTDSLDHRASVAKSHWLAYAAETQVQVETEEALLLAYEASSRSDGSTTEKALTDAIARAVTSDRFRQPLARLGVALRVSGDGKIFIAPQNSPAQQHPASPSELMSIDACLVSRNLSADAMTQFELSYRAFDLANRQCPPSFNW